MITAKAQKINTGISSLFTLAYKYLCIQSRRALAGPCQHGWHICVPVAWSQAARQQTHCGWKRSRRSQVWDVCSQQWGCEEKPAQVTELPTCLCFGWVCVRVLCSRPQTNVGGTPLSPLPHRAAPTIPVSYKTDHGQLFDTKRPSSAARKGNKRHQ